MHLLRTYVIKIMFLKSMIRRFSQLGEKFIFSHDQQKLFFVIHFDVKMATTSSAMTTVILQAASENSYEKPDQPLIYELYKHLAERVMSAAESISGPSSWAGESVNGNVDIVVETSPDPRKAMTTKAGEAKSCCHLEPKTLRYFGLLGLFLVYNGFVLAAVYFAIANNKEVDVCSGIGLLVLLTVSGYVILFSKMAGKMCRRRSSNQRRFDFLKGVKKAR